MEELILLLLNECKRIYLELLDSDSQKPIGHGVFPKCAIITYCEGKSEFLITETALRTWKFENGTLMENSDNALKPSFTPSDGKSGYFSEAAFSFSVNTANKKVYISYLLAPRYGCGLEYDLVENEGRFTIENPGMKWMA